MSGPREGQRHHRGSGATVVLDFTEGGYDIRLEDALRLSRPRSCRGARHRAPAPGRVDVARRFVRVGAMRRLVAAVGGAASFGVAGVSPVAALDGGVAVTVNTWDASGGRAYVGVQAQGRWARPGTRWCIAYYSTWNHKATIFTDPVRDQWSVQVHTCSGGTVDPLGPTMVLTSRSTPGIGVRPSTAGVLSLDLGVAVDPATAPAGTTRTVTAALTSGWLGRSATTSARRSCPGPCGSSAGRSTSATAPPAGSPRPRRTRTPLDRPRVWRRRVLGDRDRARDGSRVRRLLRPDGTPYESTVGWALDITNQASGVSGLPIEYVRPVASAAASPSGSLPDGTTAAPDPDGLTEIWWPRGLPCDLFVRAVIEREGFMRSGGVVIGQGKTRLVRYRYIRDTNDAAHATRTGVYRAADPIRIQWNTPAAGDPPYPVRVELVLETTYDDGTVRTTRVSGEISVTVIYSAAQ